MQTVGYIRVSTDEQAKSGLSLDDQRKKIEAQACVSGLDLGEIISDEGLSGKDTKRPGLQRVLSMVHTRQVECVVIAKLDRISRSIPDVVMLVDTFNQAEVGLISCSESLDTTSANGRLVVHLFGAMAQWEREVIAERTTDALAVLKAQGKRAGNIPYGFSAASDGTLFENDDEQDTITFIRLGRQAEHGWQRISNDLNTAGRRTRTGNPFSRDRVYRLARTLGLLGVRTTKKIDQVRQAFGPQAARQAEQGVFPDEDALQKQLKNPKRTKSERRYEAKDKAAKVKGEA